MNYELTKGRFAPSPTGRMHMGNVFSALLSWLSAKSKGGEWLLRIEDIDPQRSKQEYADQLMRDLEWLGLEWDGEPVYQSRRGEIYEHYLEVLRDKGVLYPSRKTRAERLAVGAPHEDNGKWKMENGECRMENGKLNAAADDNTPFAWAVHVPDETVTYIDGHYGPQTISLRKDIGDFIVRRRDGAWAYQLCVTVDDALMGITEVVRGRDLLHSAAQQLWLREVLGLNNSELCTMNYELNYTHFPLLVNTAGQRLSKRDKSLDMGVLREQYTAPQLIGLLAQYAGITAGGEASPSDLLKLFDWSTIPTEDIVV